MKPTFIVTSLIFFSLPTHAKRLCDIYSWMACPDAFAASRSTTATSLPLNSAAAPTNPASMSVDRGFGIETIMLGNSFDISLITGTGVIGSSFSVTNNEATFFGESPPEEVADNIDRREAKNKYDSPKITGLFAFQLVGAKKKNSFKLNLGVLGRYNTDTSTFTGGPGLSAAWGAFSVGAAQFTNDYYSPTTGLTQEYDTQTFTFGVKVSNMAFDWTYIKNDAVNWSRVRVLTATLFTKKFMFTYGSRQEESPYPAQVPVTLENLQDPRLDTFLAVQYLYKKNLIFGVYSNYYLLNSLSFGLTLFL